MDRWTATPDPVPQHGDVTICYEFDESSPVPANGTVTWDLPGGMSQEVAIELTPGKGHCITITVPGTAMGGTVVDNNGGSEDHGITVKPA